MKTIRILLACWFCALAALATQPPDPGALKQYREDGSFAKRLEFVKKLGKDKVRPDVAQRTMSRLRQLSGEIVPAELLPRWQGMPTKGDVNMLVLLVDFPDYPHVNGTDLIADKLFGDGQQNEFPRESLHNYYERSSYGQLHIHGNALGWYRMQHNRRWYTDTYGTGNEANRAVMQEVIQHFDTTHDFAQYDNNHDGTVDYVAIIWSGPDNGWGNFWWGYQWELNEPISVDGVQFQSFSWQWESRPVGSAYEADTIIHETGHALGLPDYYDYSENQGPDGGVGGLDMMDGNYADHNAFSKFMLEWVTPQTIPAGQANVTLRALAEFPDAVAIMPNYAGPSPFAEYFIVENRHRVKNDTGNPANGLLIWHVDARPNAKGEDFLYNNSDTVHKLLRLMEADGLEEIEQGDGKADAGDYYTQGRRFATDTTPNSRAYDGADTHVLIDNISMSGSTMTLRCTIEGSQTGPRLNLTPYLLEPFAAEGANASDLTFQVTATGQTLGYAIADDAAWLSVQPPSGSSSGPPVTHTVTFSSAGLTPGVYHATITVTAPEADNSPQTLPVTLTVMGYEISRAVDAPNLTWTAGGPGQWFEQTTVTHDNEDAAQSGRLGDRQTNWIQTTLTGPGTLSFWWKASCEESYDQLRLFVDGQLRPERLSGLTEWQSMSLTLTAGAHTVRWAYAKDDSVAANADAVWVDQVTYTPGNAPSVLASTPASLSQIAAVGQNAVAQTLSVWNEGGGTMTYSITASTNWLKVTPANESSSGAPNQHQVSYESAALAAGTYNAEIVITATGASGSPKTIPVSLRVLAGAGSIAEAVEATTSPWTTGGEVPWNAQTLVTHDGQDAAASASLDNNQTSWLQTTIKGPGMLSFWWKVSSEEEYDYLDLLLDGEYQDLYISGEVNWRQEFLFIPEGDHTVRWQYSKDDSFYSGDDSAWLDQVEFAAGASEDRVVLLEANFDQGLPSGWTVFDNEGFGVEWVFDDPGSRGNRTGGAGGFAIADSDDAGLVFVDTELVTPPLDFTGYTSARIEFQTDLLTYSGDEMADVDAFVNGEWINLWSASEDLRGPLTITVPLPAAGQKNVRISFRYWGALNDYWWQVDNVRISAINPASAARGMLAEWRKAWEDFDRNYSYFGYKGVDWAAVYAAHTNAFAQVRDGTEFAVALNNALQVLHDWHVAVKKPDGAWIGYQQNYTNNYPTSLLGRYTGGTPYQDVRGLHVIYHAWVGSTLAHVVVDYLDQAVFEPITDADIEAIFEQYKNAEGMILDVRANHGGNETNALRLASHFTDVPRTYGYTRTRITGNDHNAFTPFSAKTLLPSPGRRFTNNVVCLIGRRCLSSAEWLALMMEACPQVTLIGDRTRGGTANPMELSIPGLNVSYRISRWIGYTSEQAVFEDVGIAPAIAIPPGPASYDDAAERDYVLERAISLLKQPKLTISPLVSSSRVAVSWPSDPASQYTLLRSTNLAQALWTLANGWTSNRAGAAGTMSYTNPAAGGSVEFYRLQVK